MVICRGSLSTWLLQKFPGEGRYGREEGAIKHAFIRTRRKSLVQSAPNCTPGFTSRLHVSAGSFQGTGDHIRGTTLFYWLRSHLIIFSLVWGCYLGVISKMLSRWLRRASPGYLHSGIIPRNLSKEQRRRAFLVTGTQGFFARCTLTRWLPRGPSPAHLYSLLFLRCTIDGSRERHFL